MEQNPINVEEPIPDLNQPASPPLHDVNNAVNDQAPDPIAALQGLIAFVVANANDIIPRLGGTQITRASCKIVDVEGHNGSVRKCYLQVSTIDPAKHSNVAREVVEISDDELVEQSV